MERDAQKTIICNLPRREKGEEMNKEMMRQLGFGVEVDRVESGKCPLCRDFIDPSSFKDELSKKEFTISGMCQQCQDVCFEETVREGGE